MKEGECVCYTWLEETTKGTMLCCIHSPWLKIDQQGPGYIAATGSFIVIDIDPLELGVLGALVLPIWLNAMLFGNRLNELAAYLVAALACLDVHDLTHLLPWSYVRM